VTSDPAIRVSGLRKSYGGHDAVRGIDFEVRTGEVFGLLGPNGAGKTTTVEILEGYRERDGGEVTVLGADPWKADAAHRARIGVVPQSDTLDTELSVFDNLYVYGRYFGIPRAEVRSRAHDLLEFVQLAERSRAKVDDLSGGMKRRLTIARSLVNNPDLLLLDEPTTGLDPQARHLIWERLRRLTQEGKTLVLTTHFMEEAERLCDRLAIMDRGRIIAQGTPRALIAEHIEPQVLEVHGNGHESWAERAKALAPRVERVGDTVYAYGDDVEPLLKSISGDLSYLHRRASLEDVFLKLTGRDLRD